MLNVSKKLFLKDQMHDFWFLACVKLNQKLINADSLTNIFYTKVGYNPK